MKTTEKKYRSQIEFIYEHWQQAIQSPYHSTNQPNTHNLEPNHVGKPTEKKEAYFIWYMYFFMFNGKVWESSDITTIKQDKEHNLFYIVFVIFIDQLYSLTQIPSLTQSHVALKDKLHKSLSKTPTCLLHGAIQNTPNCVDAVEENQPSNIWP